MDCGGGFPEQTFTIEAFVKLDASPSPPGVRTKLLVAEGYEANASSTTKSFAQSWYLGFEDGSPVFAYESRTADRPTVEVKASAAATLLGQYQSVGVSVSPTLVTLYQNGLPVKSARFRGPLLPVKRVMLGGYGIQMWFREAYAYDLFQGEVDEVRVWNEVRSDAQIQHTIRESGNTNLNAAAGGSAAPVPRVHCDYTAGGAPRRLTQLGEEGIYSHLRGRTLKWSMDVSRVGCGCNAAVYLVAMPQPTAGSDSHVTRARANEPARALAQMVVTRTPGAQRTLPLPLP